MDSGHRGAVQRRVEFAPFPRGHDRTSGETQGFQHHADAHRIGGKHLSQQRDRGFIGLFARRRDRSLLGFAPGVFQHGPGQDVLGLGVRRHPETRHVDTDNAHAVDFLRQQLQWHARRGRYAEVGDDYGVVKLGVGQLEYSLANVLEQLAGDEAFRVERDITDRSAGAVEVRREGQAIDAAS